ncbi:Putative flavin reductase like domain, FMN-binding split barrel [Septoria linicola]|uniref:Flavin reductase like domain, FMN-binding split barrel n=1 Tax=Septoria linicola TaxID=215465 RepID=A0A9Q9ALI0_9PEZI|nr:putative flavin reductase like domain, FMN-binding split barrel [Septoria linicola]USW50244.1 Putative flavin reductase like domain, FMN-binding split barrel [Septoria linicola]
MSGEPEQKKADTATHENMYDSEKMVQRNPHGNFKEVEASRPEWDTTAEWRYTKTKNPDWKPGQGANDGGECLKKKHISIDPYEEGRPATFNYKLLISAIIPRPVGFVSTRSKDGSTTNLAPFSYTQVVNHDPPVFIVGYAGGMDKAKDSLKNLIDSGECTINIISEHYLEAANATSVNAPYGVSEWALTGLTPADSEVVKASRVKEAVFTVEGKLMNTQEFESRATPGKKTGVLAVIEGVRFWAREDAINKEKNILDPNVLRPIARLGGITYARVLEGIEIPRPDWEEMKKEAEPAGLVKPKRDEQ